jgi:hypothetical protein
MVHEFPNQKNTEFHLVIQAHHQSAPLQCFHTGHHFEEHHQLSGSVHGK